MRPRQQRTLKVYAVKPKRRKTYVLRIHYPDGSVREETTQETQKRKAERLASEREREASKCFTAPEGWQVFSDRYVRQVLDTRSEKSREAFYRASDLLTGYLGDFLITDLSAHHLAEWSEYLAKTLAPASVRSYLARIRASLKWASTIGLIPNCPDFTIPKVLDKPAGRPLTTEEFERMLHSCKSVCGRQHKSWSNLLWALWLSGMRVAEILDFHWDDDSHIRPIRLTSSAPLLQFPAVKHKQRKEQLTPMATDFAQWLLTKRESDRVGYVLHPRTPSSVTRAPKTVGRRISAIGCAAKVVVSRKKDGSPKYASAHDLRRSFGFRWALLVPEVVLAEMMRHKSIETTRKFYLGQSAARTADAIAEAWRKSAPQTEAEEFQHD